MAKYHAKGTGEEKLTGKNISQSSGEETSHDKLFSNEYMRQTVPFRQITCVIQADVSRIAEMLNLI